MGNKRFKKGAASFYIVAISTLILVIIAASFAAVIISEVTRTSNDDLAQSAYDSALAGVEDAKLAYYNYQNCKNGAEYSDTGFSCDALEKWVEKGEAPSDENGEIEECDMVATILGRVREGDDGVAVQESSANNMQQYYTCVTITNKTKDVLGILTEQNPEYTVRVKFDNASANDIKKVRIKWHNAVDGEVKDESNADNTYFANYWNDSGLFRKEASMPAALSVGVVQTGNTFNLSDFDSTNGNQTNRGTVYLVPKYKDHPINSENEGDKFKDATSNNKISEEGLYKSNDKAIKKLPYLVSCEKDKEYACSVDIDIPKPIGGNRSDETFIFKVALTYGKPSTHFSLEFFCENGCKDDVRYDPETGEQITVDEQAILDGVQISVDSTGKANDLYRRVETRLEPDDVAYPYPLYAIQALGGDNEGSIQKIFSTICEYNFSPTCH